MKRSSAANIDYIGFGLLGIWLASLQIMLDKGQELDWFGSKMIVWCAVISTAGFIAFHRARIGHGAFRLSIFAFFKNRNFAVGRGDDFLVGALLYATIAILPLFMQNLLNYTALAAGIAMTPRGIGAFTATIVVGRIAGQHQQPLSDHALVACCLAMRRFALGNINLQVAPGNLLWPIIISGVAAASILFP